MSCCCDPPCPETAVNANCTIDQFAAIDDAAMAVICNVVGATPEITVEEVGTHLEGFSIGACFGTSPVQQSQTVNLAGLVPGCALFVLVTWSETDLSTACAVDGALGAVVQPGVVGPNLGPVTLSPQGLANHYNFFVDTVGTALFTAEVTGAGASSIEFVWPNKQFPANPGPADGVSQIWAHQVCGDIDPANPIKTSTRSFSDWPNPNLETEPIQGQGTLPNDPEGCPAIWFAGTRHSNFAGNPEGPDGAAGTQGMVVATSPDGVATEVAEFVGVQAQTCQIGQAMGTLTGPGANTLDLDIYHNTDQFYGATAERDTAIDMIRINCPVNAGGEAEQGQCCSTITNNICNEDELVAVDLSAVNVAIGAEVGSNFSVELLLNGVVVDTVTNNRAAAGDPAVVNGVLSHATTLGPVPPGGMLQVCASIRVTCTDYAAGAGNTVSVDADTTLNLDIIP